MQKKTEVDTHSADAYQTLALVRAVAVFANQATAAIPVVNFILEQFCDYLNWPVGHAFIKAAAGDALVPSGCWYLADAKKFHAFRKTTEGLADVSADGLVAAVYQQQCLLSLEASDFAASPRARFIGDGTLASGFAAPVIVSGEPVAILEFFTDKPCSLQPAAHIVITELSQLLGAVITREQAALAKAHYIDELEKSSSSLQGILANDLDGIISIDPAGTMLSVNAAAVRMFGYTEQEMIGQNVKLLMPEPYHSEHDQYLHNYVTTGVKKIMGQGATALAKRKDGQLFPVDLAVSENRGKTYHTFTGMIRDISDRLEKQAIIEGQRRYYENLFEHFYVAAFTIDTDHKVTMWNKACEVLTGVKAADIIGTSGHRAALYQSQQPLLADLVLSEDYTAVSRCYPEGIEDCLLPSSKKSQDWVDLPKHEDSPAPTYILMCAGVIYDANLEKSGAVQAMQDITSVKQLEDSLQLRNEELLRSNKELALFSHIASHDLQEPLRMIASYTQLLERRYKDKLDADANKYIHYAVDGAARMQRLIQDLLKYSRLNTKQKIIKHVDTNKIINDTLADLMLSIQETKATVTKDDLPDITGDEQQLRQLFQNLIFNALKYHEPKRANQIHISAKTQHDNWQFCVADNGIGIDPKYHEHVFLLFKSLHTDDSYQGTGIGLCICQRIVRQHGGKLWVESALGQGSRFYFTISRRQY